MTGMIPNRKSIYRRPQSPSRPSSLLFPNSRSRHNQRHQITHNPQEHRQPSLLEAITNPRKKEYHAKSHERTHGSESVGLNACEAEGEDDAGRVGCERGPGGEDEGGGEEVGKAAPVGDGLPDDRRRNMQVLSVVLTVGLFGGDAGLQKGAVFGRDFDEREAREGGE